MPLKAAMKTAKLCVGMNLRAMLCLVAIALTPVSWDAAPAVRAADSVAAGVPAVLPEDRKAVSSTPSRDFIRSGATERRALSARADDPSSDDIAAGLPAGFATVFEPDGISTVPAAAASELHRALHIRPAATGPPHAA